MEKESNHLLPFLDVLIERQSDGSVLTSVFRKPTHTDKYLDFQSHHPMAHKISVIRTLYSRARELSSTMVQRVREEHVLKVLKENGYPGRVIQRDQPPDQPLIHHHLLLSLWQGYHYHMLTTFLMQLPGFSGI